LPRFFNNVQSPSTKGKKICHWSGTHSFLRANSVYLLVAFQVVKMGRSPTSACAAVASVTPALTPFRDASYNNLCAYKLTVEDCAKGLSQGLLHGWLDLARFNIVEYEHYEQVENGDLNWTLPGKFISFAGPHNERRRDNGYPLLAPEDYFAYFKRGGVTDVVRLNNVLYDGERFEKAGFRHHELFFTDGSIPPMSILKNFLDIAEAAKGGVAVHCKAGLGRTGSLIACYMMKHYRLTAAECIAFLRVSRPGSVLGPQQFWLEDIQADMWALGDKLGVARLEHEGELVASELLGKMRLGPTSAETTGGGGGGGGGSDAGSRIPRVYAAPETTAPIGVQQGDYLNQQKLRRQAGAVPPAVASRGPGTVTVTL
jgi:cell division cycle 14